jgi:HTH-type transcriptional regulator/antitoxin HigA
MEAEPGTAAGEELDLLVDLIEHYEEKNIQLDAPDPIAAIQFRMEQAGLNQRDLIPMIGSRAKVSEVLSGKRKLTLAMARALHEHLKIPADVLLKKSAEGNETSSIDWKRLPVKAMISHGWFPGVRSAKQTDKVRQTIQQWINQLGGEEALCPLYRKNDHARANAKSDDYALQAWCWKALVTANENRPRAEYKTGTITLTFLRDVAKLSWFDDGPKLAKEYVRKHGICFVVLRHLPKTYLDGAAFKLSDGTPVVALTLRYDRLDNFWFCLLHELAHIGRHMDGKSAAISFIDDLSLRHTEGAKRDKQEAEADQWAEEASIPEEVWKKSEVRFDPTPTTIMELAGELQIAPAIVAGKIRHELRNYRLLANFVGAGKVRCMFESEESWG